MDKPQTLQQAILYFRPNPSRSIKIAPVLNAKAEAIGNPAAGHNQASTAH